MPSTLLDFSVSTSPHPLQVSATGAIAVVASNPGGYSDQPAQDYVAVTSIVFDFGTKGSGGSELTPADGAAIRVTPPAGWGPPAVTGLRFTFIPPTGGGNIFPSAGLQFQFAQIPVNATVGTVNLSIVETASSPGNPAQPNLYPPQPRLARTTGKPIGKFPQDFSVGDLIVQPPNIPVGGSTTLSWSGSPGAVYALSYGSTRITQHVNGTPLQPSDTFPNPVAGDSPLALRNRTVFTLEVSYTPPGGSSPAIFQRQASVSVYFPNPEIELFTATPDFIEVGPSDPAVVTLSWSVKNGRKPDCVSFTVTPPLPTYPATGKGLKHTISGTQPITLTAYGDEGTTPVSETRNILVGRTASISAGIGAYAGFVAVSPDGKYALVVNQGSASLSVVDTSDADLAKWKTVATRGGFPVNPGSVAIAASAHGSFALVTSPDNSGVGGAGKLTVLTMSGSPAQWPMTVRTAGLGLRASHVSVTPDGRFAFVTCGGVHTFPGALSCVSILSINGADPNHWPVFTLSSDDQQRIMRNTRVSPRGDYAFITVGRNSGGGDLVRVLALTGADPAQWPVVATIDSGLGGGTEGVVVSPDGKLGLVPNFQDGSVQVLDLSAADPKQWRVATSIRQGIARPVNAAFSADGSFAFVTNIFENFVTVLGITPEAPARWPAFRLTRNVGVRPNGVVTAKSGPVAFVACDNGYSPGSLTVVSLAPVVTAEQAPAPVPVLHLARDPASRF